MGSQTSPLQTDRILLWTYGDSLITFTVYEDRVSRWQSLLHSIYSCASGAHIPSEEYTSA